MRMNLKLIRVKHGLRQEDMAKRTNISLPTYRAIETGIVSGKDEFWKAVQRMFFIPDEQMWEVMRNE
jgi:DNA-binding XRE family transcriptional regulator